MLPDVTALLNKPTVRADVGTNPARIYRHGSAPLGVAAPYITWSGTGTPDIVLDGPAPVDNCAIRVNVWSANTGAAVTQAEQIAEACRALIEAENYAVTSFGDEGLDQDTQRNRWSLTFTIWNDR